MKFGSGFLRTEINEIFSVLHSKEPKEPKKIKSIRFNLLHVFVTSDIVLSTYVEPLIIHVLSMKLWSLCTCGCLWGDVAKFLTKVIVIQNFRVVVTVRLEPRNRTKEPN
jgi:hypothetical protein